MISHPTVETVELRETLERVLGQFFGTERTVVSLRQQPSSYHSSFAIEELEITLEGGDRLQIIFKDLSQRAVLEGAQRNKPQFLYDPKREIETYRKVLAPRGLGPVCYGGVIEEETGRYWLFLEKVRGLELYQIGEMSVWKQAARELASIHESLAGQAKALAETVPLLRYNESYYQIWMRRAQDFLSGPGQPLEMRERIMYLSERYSRVIEHLLELPQTFIHGEFYASNIIVEEKKERVRVCPVDWEMAAIGPGLMDLAALVAGKWTEEEKAEMALAYTEALGPESNWFRSAEYFLRALEYCRLQIAVQWLGWFGRRRAYSEHTHDWLSEAISLAEKLGL